MKRLTFALLFACTSPVFAFVSAPYGWYLDANAGSTTINNENLCSNGCSTSTSGIGGNADVGYKFMPYFGMEAGYTRYANSSIKDQFDDKAGTVKHYTYYGAVKGMMPFYNSGAEIFAKLGLQRSVSRTNIVNSTAASNIGLESSGHSASGVFMAVGISYYFMPEFGVFAQWARAQNNNSVGTLNLTSVGVSFLFD